MRRVSLVTLPLFATLFTFANWYSYYGDTGRVEQVGYMWTLLAAVAVAVCASVTVYFAMRGDRVAAKLFVTVATVVGLAANYLPLLDDRIRRRMFEGFGGLITVPELFILIPVLYLSWNVSVRRQVVLLSSVGTPSVQAPPTVN